MLMHGLLLRPRDLADRQSCRCPKIPAQPPHHTTFFPRIDCQLPSAASVQCRRCRSRPRRHVLGSPASCGPAPIQSNHLLIPTDAAGRCVRVTSRSYCGGDSPSPTDGEHEPRRTQSTRSGSGEKQQVSRGGAVGEEGAWASRAYRPL